MSEEHTEHFFSRWDPDEHAALIGSWFRARGGGAGETGAGNLACYPSTGFVVDGIVAGFVHLTNSSVAIIDQWVSDPAATKEARRAALDHLIVLLCECAREHGANFVWLTTNLQSVIRQVARHGFAVNPYPFQFASRSL